ncbi:MAG: hypothetical protein CMB80_03520 [Flammeovirgaceae bacterium]|nr:hypothetical protein [Flammeovirgaceae bacterium]|tara:strand:+ start:5794 stop:6771 length:978 start_codon:yes stop_codon:yes gene_type:complete
MGFAKLLGGLTGINRQSTLRALSQSNIGAIAGEAYRLKNINAEQFAARLTPENVQDWFATRIFGNRNPSGNPVRSPTQSRSARPAGGSGAHAPRLESNGPAQIRGNVATPETNPARLLGGRTPETNPARLLGAGSTEYLPPLPPGSDTQALVRGSSRGPLATRGQQGLATTGSSSGPQGLATIPASARASAEGYGDNWTRNSNRLYKAGKWVADNPKKTLGAIGAMALAGPIDSAAGYLHGGPGYGGYIGFGEGPQRGRSALQGARTNTNFQAQQMGLSELRSNQVSAQYSLSVPQSRQRRGSSNLRASTQGLTLGLHQGRHGGY